MPLQRLLRKVAETSKTTLRNFTSPPPPSYPPEWCLTGCALWTGTVSWSLPHSLCSVCSEPGVTLIFVCSGAGLGLELEPGQQTLHPAYNSTDGWVWLDMMVTMLLRQFTRLISPLLTLVLDSPKSTMVHWIIQAYQTTQVLLGSF